MQSRVRKMAFMLALVLAALTQVPLETPRIEGRFVTFYAQAHDGQRPEILGDFNGWGRYPEADGIVGGKMDLIPGTDWFRASLELAPDARVEYGFRYGRGDPATDPRNPRTTRTFGMTRSVVEMPDYAGSSHVRSSDALRGELSSFALRDGRAVSVYLPDGYPSAAPYPVVYFHDGSDYVSGVQAPAILDASIEASAVRPLIGVFVAPLDRGVEYRGDATYLDIVRHELVPRIDDTYETMAEPRGRAIVGGSRGALGAGFVAWSDTPLFAYCGMLAPALTPTDFLARVFAQDVRPVKLYVLGGRYDVRFVGDYHNAVETFRVKGYDVEARLASIGHSPTSWRHYIPEMLASFFPRER